MVKISKILAFLILIFHVHLTTTLLAHILEERNLTMLLANISGHDLKKRDSNKLIFDPLNFKKGTIIRRPADLPIQIALIGLAASCTNLKTFLAFCLCCAFNNLDTVVIDPSDEPQLSRWERFNIWFNTNILFRTDLHDYPSTEAANHIRGPYLSDMWREYQESDYYNNNWEMGSSSNSQLPIPECPTSEAIPDYNSQQVLTPCRPQTVDDILRPLDPSTSETCILDDDPSTSTSQASTSRYPPCQFHPYSTGRSHRYECEYCRFIYEETRDYHRARNRLLRLNTEGFAQFLEVLTLASITNDHPRTQLALWEDYKQVQKRFAEFKDMKFYLEAILRHAHIMKLKVNELLDGIADDYRDDIQDLILY
ncbi:17359_t:CDS:1, partial [Gigaspora rosea]